VYSRLIAFLPSTLSTSNATNVNGVDARRIRTHSQSTGKSGLPAPSSATSSPSSRARTGSCARKPTCSVMSQPRRLRTRSGPSVETIARNPSNFSS
jgi:hypothetical protein